MIYVDRDQVAVPAPLHGAESAGVKERKSNAAKLRGRQKLSFSVYQHDNVREALDILFQLKCAYCETNVGAHDIEHFRPKGNVWTWEMVKGKKRQRSIPRAGYWWLAADWSNLLLSCTACNERRRHRKPDGKYEVRGKACFFPLANEARRARKPNDERHEVRLLLNPCEDNPLKHLKFLVDGHVVPSKSGAQARMAEETIAACALDRGDLKAARAKQAKWWNLALKLLEMGYRTKNQELIDDNLELLEEAMSSGSEYSGFAIQFIRPKLSELRRRFRKAKAASSKRATATKKKATPSARKPKPARKANQSRRTKVKTRSGG